MPKHEDKPLTAIRERYESSMSETAFTDAICAAYDLGRLNSAARSGEPPQPRCPKCKSYAVHFWGAGNKFARFILCEECGVTHPIGDMTLQELSAQFFGPSAPQPEPVFATDAASQRRIDIINLRLYARLAEENEWKDGVIHWSVFQQTLGAIATRLERLPVPSPSTPSPLPKMGSGDYSCATCGMGMVEPCEHWRSIMSVAPSGSAGQEPPKLFVYDEGIQVPDIEDFEPEGRAASAAEPNSLSVQKRKHAMQGGKMSDFKPAPVVSASPAEGLRQIPKHLWRCIGTNPETCKDYRCPVHGSGDVLKCTCGTEFEIYCPACTAAQPVAANPPQNSESEVMPTGTEQEFRPISTEVADSNNRASVGAASLKTSGLANLPKVEDATDRVFDLVADTFDSRGKLKKSDIAAILGPFFTQVSQPPTETSDKFREYRQWMDEQIKWLAAKWEKTGNFINIERAKEMLYLLSPGPSDSELAAPVTPVSGNGTRKWTDALGDYRNDLARDLTCQEGAAFKAGFLAGAASHNGLEMEERLARRGKAAQAIEAELEAAEDRITELEREIASHNGQGWVNRDQRQKEVSEWCAAAFGADHASSVPQRGLRMLEEAIEAYQSATMGLPAEEMRAKAHALVDYVMNRLSGNLAQECGGVGLTLLALCQSAGISAEAEELREIARVKSKPLEHFHKRNQVKNEAGFALPAPPSEADGPQTCIHGYPPQSCDKCGQGATEEK